jgi:hypothetical protein
MVAVLATVAMLSAAVVVVVCIDQASAQDTIFTFKQKTVKHMQWPTIYSNNGTITFGF